MKIKETFETEIKESCDVLVCGGGVAGIAAALAAARCGKKVILLERGYILGGLATAGLITVYLPLCDGFGQQVSFGLAEELLRLSISMGAEADYPANWLDRATPAGRTEKDPRFCVRFNASLFALCAERALLKAGVGIRYGCCVVGAATEGGALTAAIVEDASGRSAIGVRAAVDASGDCVLAAAAGAETSTLEAGNLLAGWYYSVGKKGYVLNAIGAPEVPDEAKTGDEPEPLGRFFGFGADVLNKMTIRSHEETLKHIVAAQKTDPSHMPTAIATTPQIRMSRRLVGKVALDISGAFAFVPDSVGIVSDWRRRGPVHEVPFASLFSPRVKNLAVAGRCTSVTDSMWDVMRVIPCCAVTGQAAGTAAALSDDFTALDVTALQARLRSDGVVIHLADLKNERIDREASFR